ncbi:MAG: hemagglutinin repeat-containing protein, partial [Gammaproteobacteria bacterium]
GNLITQGAMLSAGDDISDHIVLNISGDTRLQGVNDEVYDYFEHTQKKKFGRSKTTIRESHDVSLNETQLNAGGGLMVNVEFDDNGEPVGKSSGTVTLEGAKVNVGSNALIYGEDGVNILSGVEYNYARNETHKKGFGGFSRSGSTSITDEARLGHAEINSGGDTVLLSKGNINVVAGKIEANSITADAGFGLSEAERANATSSVNIIGDEETLSSINHIYKKGLSFSIEDNFLSIAEESHNKDWASSSTYVGSVLNARDDINIRSVGDTNIIGSQLAANDALNIDAGRDLNILSGVSTVYNKHEEETRRIGVSVSPTENGFEAFAGAETHRQGSEQTQVLSQNAVIGSPQDAEAQMMGSALLANNINLKSGGHTTILGSDLATWAQDETASSGNITIDATGKLITEAAVSSDDLSNYEERIRVGIKVTAQENVSGGKDAFETARDEGGMANTLRVIDAIQGAKDQAIGASAGIVAEVERSESQSSTGASRATTLDASNNLTLKSGDDKVHTGTLANAGNNLSVDSGGDLTIQSAQNTSSGNSHTTSASAKLGFGESSPVSGNVAYSDSENQTATKQNALFTAGNVLSLNVAGDTTMQGAVVQGTHLDVDLKGDFYIGSLQDTGNITADNASINISRSNNGNGSYGASAGKTRGDKAWVAQQTALIGIESAKINVQGHTQIDGAIVASEADNLNMETGSLSYSDIEDHDYYQSTQANIGINTSQSTAASGETGSEDSNNNKQLAVDSFGYQDATIQREQITRATIGAGNIAVREDIETGKDSLAGINRDLSNAQVITKDESSDTDLYYSNSTKDLIYSTFDTTQNNVDLLNVLNPVDFMAEVGSSTVMGIDQVDNAFADAMSLNGFIGEYSHLDEKGLINSSDAAWIGKNIEAGVKAPTAGLYQYVKDDGTTGRIGDVTTISERFEALRGGIDINELMHQNNINVDRANNATDETAAGVQEVFQTLTNLAGNDDKLALIY